MQINHLQSCIEFGKTEKKALQEEIAKKQTQIEEE